jgi:hypothetical protein
VQVRIDSAVQIRPGTPPASSNRSAADNPRLFDTYAAISGKYWRPMMTTRPSYSVRHSVRASMWSSRMATPSNVAAMATLVQIAGRTPREIATAKQMKTAIAAVANRSGQAYCWGIALVSGDSSEASAATLAATA